MEQAWVLLLSLVTCLLLAVNSFELFPIINANIQGQRFSVIVDIEKSTDNFENLSDVIALEGEKLGVEIRIQLESIFESMHRI